MEPITPGFIARWRGAELAPTANETMPTSEPKLLARSLVKVGQISSDHTPAGRNRESGIDPEQRGRIRTLTHQLEHLSLSAQRPDHNVTVARTRALRLMSEHRNIVEGILQTLSTAHAHAQNLQWNTMQQVLLHGVQNLVVRSR
jgi:hypothetical protein